MREKIAVFLAIPVAVVILLSLFYYRDSLDSIFYSNWINHTIEVMTSIRGIRSDIKEAREAELGFLETGKIRYIKPFQDAENLVWQDFENVRQLTKDNPVQQKNLDELKILLTGITAEFKKDIEQRRLYGAKASQAVIPADTDLGSMDSLQKLIIQMVDEETALLKLRNSAEQAEYKKLNQVSISAVLLVLLLSVILGFLIYHAAKNEVLITRVNNKIRVSLDDLKESEERLNLVLDSAQMGAWDLDFLNDKAVRSLRHDQIFGYQELQPEWGSRIFFDHVFPEDQDIAKRSFAQALDSGNFKLECRIIWQDKSIHWIAAYGRVYRDNAGKPSRMLGIVMDITESKDVQEKILEKTRQLKESQAFLETIFENVPYMIFVKDAKDLRFVRLNRAGEELLGIKKEDMIGKNDYDFFPKQEADFFVLKDKEVLASDQALDIPQESIDTKKKGVRLLHTKKLRVLGSDGRTPRYLLGLSEDITEKVIVEEKLKDALIELERSNKELEQFAYVASHDLQEPLRMVASFTQLLEKKYKDKLDAQAKVYIDFAVDGAKRMQKLVDDLLSFSRIGQKGAICVEVDLNQVCQRILEDMKTTIVENQAVIEWDTLPVINVNELQMTQLFMNVISNGVKYRSKKPPVIKISSMKIEDRKWQFSISDNGIGIDAQYFGKLFVIFQRLHTNKEYKGTGIGLAICKKIVENYDGRIWIESKVGEGTTFHFILKEGERI